MDAREAYLALHKASGIQVGDTVKVLRKAGDYEMGWSCQWVGSMDQAVGATRTVTHDGKRGGFEMSPDSCRYPFFVLEKIASAPPVDNVMAVLRECDFGCQQGNVERLVSVIIAECKK